MTDRKPAPAAVLVKTLRIADTLPAPRAIARHIMSSTTGAHNGLRAASYDGKVKGGTATSHPERVAEERQDASHATELDHLRRLSKASERFVVTIATLLVEVADGDPGDMDDYDWGDALKDGHLLTQLDGGERLQAAIDVGRNVTGPIGRAWGAVIDIRTIHQRYSPRAATEWERYKRNGGRADEVCEIHAALRPPMFKAKHGIPQLCKTCAGLTRRAGQRPPVELIWLLEHGTQAAYRNARARWLDACGVRLDSLGA